MLYFKFNCRGVGDPASPNPMHDANVLRMRNGTVPFEFSGFDYAKRPIRLQHYGTFVLRAGQWEQLFEDDAQLMRHLDTWV